MELQSLRESYGIYSDNEIQSASRRKREEKNTLLATGDTVSISEEARILLAKMLAKAGGTSQNEQAKTSEHPDLFAPATGQTNPTGTASAPAGKSGGAPAGGEDSDSDDQTEKIKKKIQELSAQIKAVMSTDSPAETKQTQAAPLLQQVAALQQQLTKLVTGQSRMQA